MVVGYKKLLWDESYVVGRFLASKIYSKMKHPGKDVSLIALKNSLIIHEPNSLSKPDKALVFFI